MSGKWKVWRGTALNLSIDLVSRPRYAKTTNKYSHYFVFDTGFSLPQYNMYTKIKNFIYTTIERANPYYGFIVKYIE